MADRNKLTLILGLIERALAVISRAVNGQMVTDEQLAQAKAEYQKASAIFDALKAPPKTAADGSVPGDEPIAADLEPRPAPSEDPDPLPPSLNGVPLVTLPDLSAKPANPALHASHRPVPKTQALDEPTPEDEGDYLPTPIAEVVFETPDPLDKPTPEDERANDEGEAPQEVK